MSAVCVPVGPVILLEELENKNKMTLSFHFSQLRPPYYLKLEGFRFISLYCHMIMARHVVWSEH